MQIIEPEDSDIADAADLKPYMPHLAGFDIEESKNDSSPEKHDESITAEDAGL